MTSEAREVIARLQLEPLPFEGGFFRQTWRDSAGSVIYFLITPETFSALHRLSQPEIWHFHAGDAVEHIQLGAAGVVRTHLGPDILAGDTAQLVVPARVWQAARSAVGQRASPDSNERKKPDASLDCVGRRGWSLLGCTLAPPWDERSFELGECGALLEAFPAAAEIIRALTR